MLPMPTWVPTTLERTLREVRRERLGLKSPERDTGRAYSPEEPTEQRRTRAPKAPSLPT